MSKIDGAMENGFSSGLDQLREFFEIRIEDKTIKEALAHAEYIRQACIIIMAEKYPEDKAKNLLETIEEEARKRCTIDSKR